MKLMRKGEEMKYVPDSNIMTMRERGYICADEDQTHASVPHDVSPKAPEDDTCSNQDEASPIAAERLPGQECGNDPASDDALTLDAASNHPEMP